MSEKREILKEAFGRSYTVGSEMLFMCPKCNHEKPKMSINIDKDAFKCWICDYSGTKISYLFRKHAPSLYASWAQLTNEVDISKFDSIFEEESQELCHVNLPENFKSLTGKKCKTKHKALSYLYDRGLVDADILRWKIGFCDFGDFEGRVIIPSFDINGRLDYFVARSYTGDYYKYKNPKASKKIIFNDLCIDWEDDVVLVEGVFDAIRAQNAIPILGSTLKEDHPIFQKVCQHKSEIFIAFDQDAKEKELYLATKFKAHGLTVRKIDIHPYSDVAEMSKEEFDIRKQNASIVSDLDYLHYKLDF